MITMNGKSVFQGIEIGKIRFYKNGAKAVSKSTVEDVKKEVERYVSARQKAMEQLQRLYQIALAEVGEEEAAIFEVHQMMLEDYDYNGMVTDFIEEQQMNAEYAVEQTSDTFAAMFAALEDSYMQARAADVKDISARLIGVLLNVEDKGIHLEEPMIIAAVDLAPSETIQLEKSKVLGFVTAQGSANSHTSILARNMGIPALIGIGEQLNEELDGRLAIIDGFTGMLYIDPDEDTLARMKEKQKRDDESKLLLQQLKGQEDVSIDGRKIKLFANIGNASDLDLVLQNDARGIGLFRSEFLYMESSDYPSEEYQYLKYKQVIEGMNGKPVIIRTLDIGADKQADYFQLEKEENPALGYRAIRICLTREEIFLTQLRALLRASAHGNLAIMFPMITSLWEVRRIKAIIEQVKRELENENKAFHPAVPLGVMIETPAAVMISEDLAKEVEFFSVGTNDLTQYTLAIDRQNPKLDLFYDAHHPAILKMLQIVVDSAHKNGIWAGICGELASDLELTETFLHMGYDELSVSPALILPLRKKIRASYAGDGAKEEGK